MSKLYPQTCSFVSLTDFLCMIEDAEVKNQFIEELNNGVAAYGSDENKRTMVTIDYIEGICQEVIDCPFDGFTLNDDYFKEALDALKEANPQYVDLET